MCTQEKEKNWIKATVDDEKYHEAYQKETQSLEMVHHQSTSGYCKKDYEEFQAFKKIQNQVKKAVRLAKRNFERK